jgi:hypothetical protein
MREEQKKECIKIEISNLWNKILNKNIQVYLLNNKKIFCKWLNRRPVFIDKFLEFSGQRWWNDENHRKKAFFSAVELIKKVHSENLSNNDFQQGDKSYEFKWITPKWRLVGVHIKELNESWDKILRLVSVFWKEKK